MFLEELKGIFRGYMEHRPIHTEYYDSIIVHLDKLTILWEKQLASEQSKLVRENNPNGIN